jgi:hypothetical protein
VRLIGVEAAGQGLDTGKHAASLSAGSPGVLHGNRTYLLQDDNGQITETHSVSAGLDYPGVGPEHAYLKDIGRAEYVGITDDEALAGLPPPVPHRGHHPGAGVQPRGGLCDEAGRDDAPTSICWSTCPAAATRTSAPWPTCRAPSSSAGRRAAGSPSKARRRSR